MGFLRSKIRIETDRMTLRPPEHGDFRQWRDLRIESADFLKPWEPTWADDHLTRKAFTNRVYWAQRSISGDTGLPLFMFERYSGQLVGAVTLDNIRRGPNQAATVGYWVGARFARMGFMSEAVSSLIYHAFTELDLSRIESACLPENQASRAVLEKCGYKYEGVAQSYLQINGRWRTHVLYANLRHDRRGKSDAS